MKSMLVLCFFHRCLRMLQDEIYSYALDVCCYNMCMNPNNTDYETVTIASD